MSWVGGLSALIERRYSEPLPKSVPVRLLSSYESLGLVSRSGHDGHRCRDWCACTRSKPEYSGCSGTSFREQLLAAFVPIRFRPSYRIETGEQHAAPDTTPKGSSFSGFVLRRVMRIRSSQHFDSLCCKQCSQPPSHDAARAPLAPWSAFFFPRLTLGAG